MSGSASPTPVQVTPSVLTQTSRHPTSSLSTNQSFSIPFSQTDSQSILLLPFSAPSITSSYSTLLPLILKLLLSQLSTQPSILSQSSALSYIKILDILLSSNGQASKTTLPSQTGINVAQFLADKLIRNGFHSSLRRHLLNFVSFKRVSLRGILLTEREKSI